MILILDADRWLSYIWSETDAVAVLAECRISDVLYSYRSAD